jgi:hypothetical protein
MTKARTLADNFAADINGITAGTGITGGGTSGTVTVTNEMATAIDAKGDLVGGTGADTFARLEVGANGTVLTADSVETTGLKWVTPATGALALISTTTIGSAVASVTVTGAFSATYDNYLITVSDGEGSANVTGRLTLGATTSGYYMSGFFVTMTSTTVTGANINNGAHWDSTRFSTTAHSGHINLQNPFLSKNTTFNSNLIGAKSDNYMAYYSGFLNNTTSYTDFTLTAASGTMTGGIIRVYGYQNS